MPRGVSATGGVPPFPRVTMSPKDEIHLLKIVKDDDEFRYAFCVSSMAKPRQHEIAQRLCLEVMKSEMYFLNYAKKTGMIKQVDGVWSPTDKWTTKVHNPVRTKLRAMTDSYKKAQEKYKKVLKPEYTEFRDVPPHARGDLLFDCPHFFRLKQLCDPTEPARVPRVRTPAPEPARQVRPRLEIANRPVNRTFPSPSPSPPPSAGSPSRSPSSEPAPARPFLALRPMTNATRPESSSSFTPAPRPTVRQNAVASSSRVPIKVESASCSSSSSDSSDVEMISATAATRSRVRQNAVASSSRVPIKIESSLSISSSSSSTSESSSDHEMENDWISDADEGSASPEKRDWLNLRGPGLPGLPETVTTRSSTAAERARRDDGDTESTKKSPAMDMARTTAADAGRSGRRTPAASSSRGPQLHTRSNVLALADHTGSASDDEDGYESVSDTDIVQGSSGDMVVPGTVSLSHSVDIRAKKMTVTHIGRRFRAAIDDTPVSHDGPKVPKAIILWRHLGLRYSRARTVEDKDKIVYQAQFNLLCQAVSGIAHLMVIPPVLKGHVIRFDPVTQVVKLDERVKQLERFADLAGATVCKDEADLWTDNPCRRRMHVSFFRTGFDEKKSYFKRGASTYTVYHYSLLAFGKFCSVELGDIGALSFA